MNFGRLNDNVMDSCKCGCKVGLGRYNVSEDEQQNNVHSLKMCPKFSSC